jgi:hypothetical protein
LTQPHRSTYFEAMKTVSIDIAAPVFELVAQEARRLNREPSEVISEAVDRYLHPGERAAATHSVLDIKSYPLGPPSPPWTTRAEVLEGFMDDRG